MIEELARPNRLDQDKLEALRDLFPQVFTEGRIDFDALREELSGNLDELEPGDEHYGLNWPGKRRAKRLANLSSSGTLRPVLGEGVNEETTKNLIIEGDNLEVLRILQKSYAERVKMIYIDPPYNTGNDFIYKDNFKETVEAYLRKSGQADEEGLLVSNPKSSGRYHSNWLSMIYPRLRLARNLLREDGIIFVSIDDHELQNLRAVMDEIFGQENFIGVIVVQLNPRGRHLDEFIAKTHEYVVVYVRDITSDALGQLPKDERMEAEYNRKDAKGLYRELGLRNRNPAFNKRTRPNLFFPIYVNPSEGTVNLQKDETHTIEVWPLNSKGEESCWTWGRSKVSLEKSLLVGHQNSKGEWQVFRKDYLFSEDGKRSTTKAKTLWIDKEINNDYGKKAIQRLFGRNVFDFPKSPEFIKKLVQLGSTNGIVMDFFAGSGVLAEAVLEQNKQDNSDRQFVLVQLPELTNDEDYIKISEVTKERVRQVSASLSKHGFEGDSGFKFLALEKSTFRRWQSYDGGNTQNLNKLFEQLESPFVTGWTSGDVLTEVMLLEGYPLDGNVQESEVFAENVVYQIEHIELEAKLLVCLDELLSESTIEAVSTFPNDVFICLDKALTDESKLRLSNSLRVKTL